ncbi:fructose-bisphosphate aldolase [Thiothrix litoralis]|uniref:fructose-bisphosphate aldolase n=1 Tax=Thiothrix litoralis TaxID=2891210 RepID=A0ABX7X0W6_9GAMM|nr:class I fructose-bisphosphate aldolase [Thiothrix litoralis]QTR48263.1 fructose-bisphosphate aldolase [Thiothrix litoralis]
MNTQALINTAQALVADNKGILAMDESNPTCNKRFAKLDIPQTEEAHRAYREMIVTTAGLGECISGAILYDETIRQTTSAGIPFVQAVMDAGIIPGIKTAKVVADATVRCFLRAVPAAVPGIMFLSGGQSAELASSRLNAMNVGFKSRAPWALSFSYGRALQQPAMEAWAGQDANVKAAQQALLQRARCNLAARRGEYSAAMEV